MRVPPTVVDVYVHFIRARGLMGSNKVGPTWDFEMVLMHIRDIHNNITNNNAYYY